MKEEPTLAEMMEACALDAVDHARKVNVELDFSPESVEQVEAILSTMSRSIPKTFLGKLFRRGPSPHQIGELANTYGGYLGEVIRREVGGEWCLDEENKFIGLRCGEGVIWPPTKVYKRLVNGAEDNVSVYCKVLLQQYLK
jgi:hypothetical protein